jgi:hypothetical protein
MKHELWIMNCQRKQILIFRIWTETEEKRITGWGEPGIESIDNDFNSGQL